MNSTLQMIRGDTAKYNFQRLDADGQVITTTPDALYFTVKETTNKLAVVFQKTLEDMTVDSDGTYHFTIEPADTDGLQNCNKYTSVVDLGSLRSSVLTGSSYYMNYFSTYYSTADSYRIGITIRGTYASNWKSLLPDSTTYPYRKLIIR